MIHFWDLATDPQHNPGPPECIEAWGNGAHQFLRGTIYLTKTGWNIYVVCTFILLQSDWDYAPHQDFLHSGGPVIFLFIKSSCATQWCHVLYRSCNCNWKFEDFWPNLQLIIDSWHFLQISGWWSSPNFFCNLIKELDLSCASVVHCVTSFSSALAL